VRVPVRTLGNGLLGALCGGALALVLALAVPVTFGARPLVVLTGSMEPALDTGDVVITKAIPPGEARVGDIVTFRDPHRGGRLVTHRVRDVSARGSRIGFVTRGDANNASDRWEVGARDEVSRSVVRIPELGHVLSLLHRPAGVVALVFVPLLALLVLELLGIWRPRREEAEGEAA
jgi:signal peptidase I